MAGNDGVPDRVHLVGVGGDGMAGIAQYLADMGRWVSGSDLRSSPELDRLADLGVKIFGEHKAAHAADAAIVVVSDAVPPSNVELAEARLRDIPILRRAEFLDRLGRQKKAIFVAGSHGKSSTTAMIAQVLESCSAQPSFVIGAEAPSLDNRRARFQPGEWFVCEACEAFQNLTPLHPHIAVITNIDDDHFEHYGSQARIDAAFREFAGRTDKVGAVIVHGDDPGIARALAGTRIPVTTFGFAETNDLRCFSFEFDRQQSRLGLSLAGRPLGSVTLPIPGRHAALNALACIAVCLRLGIGCKDIARALGSFPGVARRWQDHGLLKGVRLVDDYAHHPTALDTSIRTARAIRTEGQRLVIAFQPQLYSRTQRLLREFARALSACDLVILLEIDPGGERDTSGVRSALIGDEIRRIGGAVEAFDDVDDLVERVGRYVEPGDFLLIAGAGSIRTAVTRLRHRLRTPANPRPAHAAGRQSLGGLSRPPGPDATVAPLGQSVLALFCFHVRNAPERCAVSDHARQISYGELDLASDVFATVLQSRGLGYGSVVGVSLASCIGLIVAILAVAKLGGVYLPLDPSLPSERARFMLGRAGSGLLVTTPGSRIDADLAEVGKVYMEDAFAEAPVRDGRTPGERLRQTVSWALDRTKLAYICFTSGSTGRPKGVAIRHASLFGLISDIVPRFGIGPHTRTALNTSISFDVSLAEIWMTLCGGGRLCVTEAARPLVGARLADFLEANDVTHLAVTPSVLDSLPHRKLPALGCIVCAGEACTSPLVDAWAPGRRFFNAYGPTEATVYATAAECRANARITIGKALGHVRTYVLDESLRPVGPGETGELCLGGMAVADGYIGAEEAAGERFCQLHTDDEKAVTIYRTGDLVQQDEDSNLVFLGRRDQQVKILGNRIEIEEIEQTMRPLPGVADAAVCVREGSGTKELVCFVEMENGKALEPDAMRRRLAAWLPAYMIPAHFIQTLSIPMTPSGKKDRRLLLETHGRDIVQRAFFEEGRTDVERRLASIWQDVLASGAPVGMYDDFASLGGDSLKGLLLIAAMENRFGFTVPPGYLDRFTNITNLAVQVEDLLWKQEPEGIEPATGFCASRIYAQQRHLTAGWSGSRVNEGGLIVSVGNPHPTYELFVCVQYEEEIQQLSRHLGEPFRVHGMRSGHLVMPYTEPNVELLSGHYLDEMAVIAPSGHVLIAGICQGGTIARAMAHALCQQGCPPKLLVLVEQARLSAYDGELAFFYSEESYLNPFRRFEADLARYDEVYASRYSVDILPGPHGRFHVEPYVQAFVAKLMERIRLLPPPDDSEI